MEQEKDNFWLYIGAIIVAAIIGVFLLKGREMEVSGAGAAYQELDSQVVKQMRNAK